MKNVSIAQRITLTLAIALLSMIGVGGYALWGLGAAQSRFEYVQVNSMPSVKVLSEVIFAVKDMRTLIRDHILSEGTSAKNEVARRFAELQQLVEKDFERYEKELTSDENDKKLIQADRAAFATYVARNKEVMEKSLANDMQGAHKLLGGLATQMNKAVADHIEYNWKLLEDTRKANQADYNTVKWVQIVAILLAFAVSGALGYAVIQEIRTRMNRLSGLMTQVNETLDFTTRIPITRLDELGLTGDAFNKLLDKMQGNLKTIAEGALSVAASANAMATTSGEVATASHQQSEAASGMAATVEEMTVSINHVADRAQEANRLSSDSGKLASDGEKIIGQTARDTQDIAHTVNDAAALIHGLEQHSQQIANVVQVIKDVADQTNLLALNAAIEAARAGEQGRGFAVVADEVRKLAERTASSTQEIAQTIDAMRGSASNAVSGMEGVVSKVTLGVERAQEANAAIQQIGEGSRNAVGMVEEIAEAIREQGAATNNIASHVERIAQMSEESSAAAANSADAAQELDRLATEMQRIVSAYRL